MKTLFAVSLLCLLLACSTEKKTEETKASPQSTTDGSSEFQYLVGLPLDSVQALNGVPFYLSEFRADLHVLNWEGGTFSGKKIGVSFTKENSDGYYVMLSRDLIDEKRDIKVEAVYEWDGVEPAAPCQGFLGEYPFASYRLITEEDLNRPDVNAKFMRNEIFARHGYKFKSQDLIDHFRQQWWYEGSAENAEKVTLTDLEKKNIEFISKWETEKTKP